MTLTRHTRNSPHKPQSGTPPIRWQNTVPVDEIPDSALPRFYFSTDHHLYALVYQRTQNSYLDTLFIETPVYRLDFLAPLLKLPWTGNTWQRIIEDLLEADERATLLHLSPAYSSHLGHLTVTRPNASPLDLNCISLLQPSHTTEDIDEFRLTTMERRSV